MPTNSPDTGALTPAREQEIRNEALAAWEAYRLAREAEIDHLRAQLALKDEQIVNLQRELFVRKLGTVQRDQEQA